MPAKKDKDSNGLFWRWGSKGKKYYFRKGNPISEGIAKARAKRQGRVINWRKHGGGK